MKIWNWLKNRDCLLDVIHPSHVFMTYDDLRTWNIKSLEMISIKDQEEMRDVLNDIVIIARWDK